MLDGQRQRGEPMTGRYFILLNAASLAIPLVGCGSIDPCGNTVVSRVGSPRGAHEAIVFERDCGATTRWSTQVAIVRDGATFLERPTFLRSTESGSALVIDDRAARPGVPGTAVAARWADDTHVALEYDAGAVVLSWSKVVDGVTVEPRATERNR